VARLKVTVSPVTGINDIEITEVLQLPILRACCGGGTDRRSVR